MFDHSSMMFPETAHFSGRVVHGTTTELLLAIDNSSVNDKADYIPFITFAQSLKKEIS